MPAELTTLLFTCLLAVGHGGPPPRGAPEAKMLEFIGAFESQPGQWLDPLSVHEREWQAAPPLPDGESHA